MTWQHRTEVLRTACNIDAPASQPASTAAQLRTRGRALLCAPYGVDSENLGCEETANVGASFRVARSSGLPVLARPRRSCLKQETKSSDKQANAGFAPSPLGGIIAQAVVVPSPCFQTWYLAIGTAIAIGSYSVPSFCSMPVASSSCPGSRQFRGGVVAGACVAAQGVVARIGGTALYSEMCMEYVAI